jgi:hypothetical protein
MATLVLSPYGSRMSTGAGAIDLVINAIPIGREFTEAEVVQEVRRRKLKERGGIYEHLYSLQKRGHIRRSANGWQRLN